MAPSAPASGRLAAFTLNGERFPLGSSSTTARQTEAAAPSAQSTSATASTQRGKGKQKAQETTAPRSEPKLPAPASTSGETQGSSSSASDSVASSAPPEADEYLGSPHWRPGKMRPLMAMPPQAERLDSLQQARAGESFCTYGAAALLTSPPSANATRRHKQQRKQDVMNRWSPGVITHCISGDPQQQRLRPGAPYKPTTRAEIKARNETEDGLPKRWQTMSSDCITPASASSGNAKGKGKGKATVGGQHGNTAMQLDDDEKAKTSGAGAGPSSSPTTGSAAPTQDKGGTAMQLDDDEKAEKAGATSPRARGARGKGAAKQAKKSGAANKGAGRSKSFKDAVNRGLAPQDEKAGPGNQDARGRKVREECLGFLGSADLGTKPASQQQRADACDDLDTAFIIDDPGKTVPVFLFILTTDQNGERVPRKFWVKNGIWHGPTRAYQRRYAYARGWFSYDLARTKEATTAASSPADAGTAAPSAATTDVPSSQQAQPAQADQGAQPAQGAQQAQPAQADQPAQPAQSVSNVLLDSEGLRLVQITYLVADALFKSSTDVTKRRYLKDRVRSPLAWRLNVLLTRWHCRTRRPSSTGSAMASHRWSDSMCHTTTRLHERPARRRSERVCALCCATQRHRCLMRRARPSRRRRAKVASTPLAASQPQKADPRPKSASSVSAAGTGACRG